MQGQEFKIFNLEMERVSIIYGLFLIVWGIIICFVSQSGSMTSYIPSFLGLPIVLFGYLFSVLTVFYAPLSLTASARYSVIIFGMIFGFLILGETPTYNMIIGAIIITLSGLFVIKREKEIGKIK